MRGQFGFTCLFWYVFYFEPFPLVDVSFLDFVAFAFIFMDTRIGSDRIMQLNMIYFCVSFFFSSRNGLPCDCFFFKVFPTRQLMIQFFLTRFAARSSWAALTIQETACSSYRILACSCTDNCSAVCTYTQIHCVHVFFRDVF